MKNDTKISHQKWRWQWVALFALTITLVLITAIYPASDPDLYIMLATGRYVAQTGKAPSVDLWSHTAYGQPWQMHEWLSSLLFYGLYLLGGINGIILFKALALTLAFFLGLQIVRLRGASPFSALLSSALALLVLNHAFAERIQLISFVFFLLSLYLLELFRSGRIKKWIYLLSTTGMFIIWANMHLGYIIGLGLYGLTLVDGFFEGIKNKEWGLIRWSSAAFLLAVLATGLTPYGYDLTIEAVKGFYDPVRQEYDVLVWKSVLEYQPLLSPGFSREPFVIYGIVWLTYCFMGLSLNFKKTRLSEWLLFIVFLRYTYWTTRYLWFLAWLSFPFTAVNWQGVGDYLSSKFKVQSSKFRLTNNAAFAGLVILVLAGAAFYQRSGKHLWQRAGLGWKPRMYSDAGAGFLKKHLDGGKVYNDFDIGGYLLWQRIPVFVDGRIAPYAGTEVLDDFFRIYGGRLGLLDEYGVDWIILPYAKTSQTDAFTRFNSHLKVDGGWALVYWDDACLIYVRRAGKYSPVIRQYEYRYANPAVFDFGHPPREYLGELERKLAEEPGALMPRIMAGNYFFFNGDAAMAEREFRKVLAADPDNAPAHNNLGNAYLRQGRLEEAISSYKKAVKLDVNLGLAYSNWGYALEALGDVKKAVKLYAIATRVTPGDAWPHNRLGEIEMKRRNRAKALEHWRRGAAIDPGSEAARNLWKETEGR